MECGNCDLLRTARRAFVFASEYRYRKAKLPPEVGEQRRAKLFLFQSASLFVIDFALITPISMMVLQQKRVAYSLIPAIAMAAYTTYKITLSYVYPLRLHELCRMGAVNRAFCGCVGACGKISQERFTASAK